MEKKYCRLLLPMPHQDYFKWVNLLSLTLCLVLGKLEGKKVEGEKG
jgi:hypothetical protein